MMVYQANKPTCSACGHPLEDSDPREQHAGKVYHANNSYCREAWHRAKEGLPA